MTNMIRLDSKEPMGKQIWEEEVSTEQILTWIDEWDTETTEEKQIEISNK